MSHFFSIRLYIVQMGGYYIGIPIYVILLLIHAALQTERLCTMDHHVYDVIICTYIKTMNMQLWKLGAFSDTYIVQVTYSIKKQILMPFSMHENIFFQKENISTKMRLKNIELWSVQCHLYYYIYISEKMGFRVSFMYTAFHYNILMHYDMP